MTINDTIAVTDFHGAGNLHGDSSPIESGWEHQVRAASLIHKILQTRTVNSHVKGVGARHTEAGRIGAGREETDGETCQLACGGLRRFVGFLFVGGHHDFFGEHLLEGVMKTAGAGCVQGAKIEANGLDFFDAESGEKPLRKAARGGEQERKGKEESTKRTSPDEAPASGKNACEEGRARFNRGEICSKPRQGDVGIRFGDGGRAIEGSEVRAHAQSGGREGFRADAASGARSNVSLEFGGLERRKLVVDIGAQSVVSGAVHETS
jgi:hypothetical protein